MPRDDVIFGNDEDDRLTGDGGNDRLDGGGRLGDGSNVLNSSTGTNGSPSIYCEYSI